MDEGSFERLVRRLEQQARAEPVRYRRNVLLLAVLGYGFLVGFLLAVLAAAAAFAYATATGRAHMILLLVPTIALAWALVQALVVQMEPPTGVRVTRETAPALHGMVEDLRAAVGSPEIHRLLLTPDANAAIMQIPRPTGLLGSTNYLLVGVPYLLGLTPDELQAVVAHELAHLSRRHGRSGAFVYGLRLRWLQFLTTLGARRSIWTVHMLRFFSWYAPYFAAYTLPLARAHEFEADSIAAEELGAEAAGAALVSAMLTSSWVGEVFLQGVLARAGDEAEPPAALFDELAAQIQDARTWPDLEAWFRSELERETDVLDTHPSLRERLEHVRLDPQLALARARRPLDRRAAQAFLGEGEAQVVAKAGALWADEFGFEWRTRHAETLGERKELRILEDLAAHDSLHGENALRLARLTERHHGAEEALEQYRGLLDGELDAQARFAIGRILLARGDDAGLAYLEAAAAADPGVEASACMLASGFLAARGRAEEAERYRLRVEQALLPAG